jgi:oligopeptide transport system ATP-binding protein
MLEVKNLRVHFVQDEGGVVRAVDGVSYSVKKGECAAIIGESGSGKTVSALSVMRLIPFPPGIVAGGEILFDGEDLLQFTDAEMMAVRGKRISMIFQEPSAALNPVLTIGAQIEEALRLHSDISRIEAHEKAIEVLRMVDIPNPEWRVNEYPHQFSGGMQQRAMIAMAMCLEPDLLIADEPTTALDVTVQAQVLGQLDYLRRKMDSSLLIITHNLGIVAHYAESVKIMYGGKIVEDGPTREIFKYPHHPYTVGLIKAVPRLDRPQTEELYMIEGEPPDMRTIPENSCAFAPRCSFAEERCHRETPKAALVGKDHLCACFRADAVAAGGGGL